MNPITAKPLTVEEAVAYLTAHNGPASRHYWEPLIEHISQQKEIINNSDAVLAEEKARFQRWQEQSTQRERELMQELTKAQTRIRFLETGIRQSAELLDETLRAKG